MSRTIALLIGVPLVLILVAALLLGVLVDKEKILELATATLQEQTGITLDVAGEAELDLFPGVAVALADVSLQMPGEQQSVLRIRSLSIGVQLWPLLSGKVAVDALRVRGLDASLVQQEVPESADTSRLTDRQLDEFYASRRRELAEAGGAAGSEAVLAVPLALAVQSLELTDSRIEWVEAGGAGATVLEIPRLEINGLNLDGNPVRLRGTLRLPGEEPVSLDLDGHLRIDQQQQALDLQNLKLSIAGATAAPLELQAGGEIDLGRQVADLLIALQLGDTRGSGGLRYARFESPQVDARLSLNRFDPALLVLAGPEAAAEAAAEPTGAGGDEPLPLDALRLVDTRAELAIDQAVFGAHAVTGAQMSLRAREGVVELTSLTGDLHGGRLDLRATLNGRHNVATLDSTGSLTNLDIATALAAVEAEPLASGSATLDWQLTSAGSTRNELVAGLTGPVRLTTGEVVLDKLGIQGMFCQAVALINQEALTARFPPGTRFETLSADIELADGKARLSPLRASLPGISLKGAGALDLLSQDFKATFKAKLSPRLEELDRACRVSKRLTAIDWPVRCAGNTASDPADWCRVDTQEIIEDLAKGEATRTIQKEAGKLLDKLFK